MQIDIESIVIRKRTRHSLGDLSSLMESFTKFGQLCPILITRDSFLIAGNRRIESARRLGWKTINAIVIDRESEHAALEIELEENVERKELQPEELREGIDRLQRLHRKPWKKRILSSLIRIIKQIVVRPINGLYSRLFLRNK